MSVGSCKSSARFPLSVGSQPTSGSRGIGSTWPCMVDEQENVLLGSNALLLLMKPPLSDRPKRQFTCLRHVSIFPAGCVLAFSVTEAAPTPCKRTGFHINSISL